MERTTKNGNALLNLLPLNPLKGTFISSMPICTIVKSVSRQTLCPMLSALCLLPPPPVLRYYASSRMQTPGSHDFPTNTSLIAGEVFLLDFCKTLPFYFSLVIGYSILKTSKFCLLTVP
jgi:hypothetical protein